MEPSEFLKWYLLLYEALFVLGVMFLVMWMLGLTGDHDVDVDHDLDVDHDIDVDHDVDHDTDADHDVEAHGLGHTLATLLGIGRCPVGIIFFSFTVIFAFLGFLCVHILKPILVIPALFGSVSYVISFILAFILTGRLANLIGKFMPTNETFVVTKQSLVTRIGKVQFSIKVNSIGTARVIDANGDGHTLKAKNVGDVDLKNGDPVLILSYDSSCNLFNVTKHDPELV